MCYVYICACIHMRCVYMAQEGRRCVRACVPCWSLPSWGWPCRVVSDVARDTTSQRWGCYYSDLSGAISRRGGLEQGGRDRRVHVPSLCLLTGTEGDDDWFCGWGERGHREALGATGGDGAPLPARSLHTGQKVVLFLLHRLLLSPRDRGGLN